MKKKINGKTYNTLTSKKVCSYVVNDGHLDWIHELYQTKSGEYFCYTYVDLPGKGPFLEKLHLVSEYDVCHMMERSGSMNGEEKVTVLYGLKDYFSSEDTEYLKVTGKCGLVLFDFGSWEVTIDIDGEEWVKMKTKGKVDFDVNDINQIKFIRSQWRIIREKYLIERFGKRTKMKTKKVTGDSQEVISTLSELIINEEINVVLFSDYSDMFSPDDLEDEIYYNTPWFSNGLEMESFYINDVKSGIQFHKEGGDLVENVYEC